MTRDRTGPPPRSRARSPGRRTTLLWLPGAVTHRSHGELIFQRFGPVWGGLSAGDLVVTRSLQPESRCQGVRVFVLLITLMVVYTLFAALGAPPSHDRRSPHDDHAPLPARTRQRLGRSGSHPGKPDDDLVAHLRVIRADGDEAMRAAEEYDPNGSLKLAACKDAEAAETLLATWSLC